MNEFDKVQYQAAAHIAQNWLDPEQQKLALQKMDEIEGKSAGPRMDRSSAYAKLKATGRYPDDQINAKFDGSRPEEAIMAGILSDEMSTQIDADFSGREKRNLLSIRRFPSRWTKILALPLPVPGHLWSNRLNRKSRGISARSGRAFIPGSREGSP